METQNSRRLRRTQARGGLFGFMVGIGGTVSTYHQRFDVLETEGGYTIIYRGGRWLIRFNATDGSVEILAGNNTIRVDDGIWLNERRIDRACFFGWGCLSANELRLLAFIFVALWYWRVREQALRRLACMLHFGEESQTPVGGQTPVGSPDEYLYGDLDRFLIELGRALGTSRLDHKVSRSPSGYVITDSYGEWRAELNLNGDIEITTSDGGHIRIVGLAVCLGAHEIRIMLFTYVVLWYWRIGERDTIRRLAQMIRPCVG